VDDREAIWELDRWWSLHIARPFETTGIPDSKSNPLLVEPLAELAGDVKSATHETRQDRVSATDQSA